MFLYIFAAYFLVLAGYEYFFAGEKYYKRWFGMSGNDSSDYDIRKVKRVRGITLTSFAVIVATVYFFGIASFLFVFLILALIILHYVIIFRYCKKQPAKQ